MSNQVALEALNAYLRTLAEVEPVLAKYVFDNIASSLSDAARNSISLITFGNGSNLGNVTIGTAAGRDVITGTTNISESAHVEGSVIGVNLGNVTINSPHVTSSAIQTYLRELDRRTRHFPTLRDSSLFKTYILLPLQHLYIEPATELRVPLELSADKKPADHFVNNDIRNGLRQTSDPDFQLPQDAIFVSGSSNRSTRATQSDPARLILEQAVLASELARRHMRLLLTGEPGSGKTTFLRAFARSLIEHYMAAEESRSSQSASPPGTRIPFIVGLKEVAKALLHREGSKISLVGAILEVLGATGDYSEKASIAFSEALDRGSLTLLLDGLDTVPAQRNEAASVGRQELLVSIADFAATYDNAQIIITCQSQGITDSVVKWLDWYVAPLASFTLGQIRHYVAAYYAVLVYKAVLQPETAAKLRDDLISLIADQPQLRELASSPQILSLLAFIHAERGTLPHDRARLYDRVLNLLLHNYVHNVPNKESGSSQREQGIERLILNRLAYIAYKQASDSNSRTLLSRDILLSEVATTLHELSSRVANPEHWIEIILRSGILRLFPEGGYGFSHRELQDYCTGCYIIQKASKIHQILQQRHAIYWKRSVHLGLETLLDDRPFMLERILLDLLDNEEGNKKKPQSCWYDDILLAAELCYDCGWETLDRNDMNIRRLQRELRSGLVSLMQSKDQVQPLPQRVRATHHLSVIGDPRIPVSAEQWRESIRVAAHTSIPARLSAVLPYWCAVETGTYLVGSQERVRRPPVDDLQRASFMLQEQFWIARYLITNAQWKAWSAILEEQPLYADNLELGHPAKPVIGITWEAAFHFCQLLTSALIDVLPVGYVLRLPTEIEWEIAAGGKNGQRYPWGTRWYPDRAASLENLSQYELHAPLPVGCFPAGAAACGVMDMAGNVAEWTTDSWSNAQNHEDEQRHLRVVRGGGHQGNRNTLRCASREYRHPEFDRSVGLRIVLARGERQSYEDS